MSINPATSEDCTRDDNRSSCAEPNVYVDVNVATDMFLVPVSKPSILSAETLGLDLSDDVITDSRSELVYIPSNNTSSGTGDCLSSPSVNWTPQVATFCCQSSSTADDAEFSSVITLPTDIYLLNARKSNLCDGVTMNFDPLGLSTLSASQTTEVSSQQLCAEDTGSPVTLDILTDRQLRRQREYACSAINRSQSQMLHSLLEADILLPVSLGDVYSSLESSNVCSMSKAKSVELTPVVISSLFSNDDSGTSSTRFGDICALGNMATQNQSADTLLCNPSVLKMCYQQDCTKTTPVIVTSAKTTSVTCCDISVETSGRFIFDEMKDGACHESLTMSESAKTVLVNYGHTSCKESHQVLQTSKSLATPTDIVGHSAEASRDFVAQPDTSYLPLDVSSNYRCASSLGTVDETKSNLLKSVESSDVFRVIAEERTGETSSAGTGSKNGESAQGMLNCHSVETVSCQESACIMFEEPNTVNCIPLIMKNDSTAQALTEILYAESPLVQRGNQAEIVLQNAAAVSTCIKATCSGQFQASPALRTKLEPHELTLAEVCNIVQAVGDKPVDDLLNRYWSGCPISDDCDTTRLSFDEIGCNDNSRQDCCHSILSQNESKTSRQIDTTSWMNVTEMKNFANSHQNSCVVQGELMVSDECNNPESSGIDERDDFRSATDSIFVEDFLACVGSKERIQRTYVDNQHCLELIEGCSYNNCASSQLVEIPIDLHDVINAIDIKSMAYGCEKNCNDLPDPEGCVSTDMSLFINSLLPASAETRCCSSREENCFPSALSESVDCCVPCSEASVVVHRHSTSNQDGLVPSVDKQIKLNEIHRQSFTHASNETSGHQRNDLQNDRHAVATNAPITTLTYNVDDSVRESAAEPSFFDCHFESPLVPAQWCDGSSVSRLNFEEGYSYFNGVELDKSEKQVIRTVSLKTENFERRFQTSVEECVVNEQLIVNLMSVSRTRFINVSDHERSTSTVGAEHHVPMISCSSDDVRLPTCYLDNILPTGTSHAGQIEVGCLRSNRKLSASVFSSKSTYGTFDSSTTARICESASEWDSPAVDLLTNDITSFTKSTNDDERQQTVDDVTCGVSSVTAAFYDDQAAALNDGGAVVSITSCGSQVKLDSGLQPSSTKSSRAGLSENDVIELETSSAGETVSDIASMLLIPTTLPSTSMKSAKATDELKTLAADDPCSPQTCSNYASIEPAVKSTYSCCVVPHRNVSHLNSSTEYRNSDQLIDDGLQNDGGDVMMYEEASCFKRARLDDERQSVLVDSKIVDEFSKPVSLSGGEGCGRVFTSHGSAFRWQYAPAADLYRSASVASHDDEQSSVVVEPDAVDAVFPLRSCTRPLRLGLSKRQNLTTLHRNYKKTSQ